METIGPNFTNFLFSAAANDQLLTLRTLTQSVSIEKSLKNITELSLGISIESCSIILSSLSFD